MMISELRGRTSGMAPRHRMVQRSQDRWARRLALSRSKEVRCPHGGAVCCLQIDPVENRFMLSGGSDATIALYDLEKVDDDGDDGAEDGGGGGGGGGGGRRAT